MIHFNIQISIQRVDQPEPPTLRTERQVTEMLKLAITADTEQEAYAKAHRMLAANEPTEGVAITLADTVARMPR